MEDPILCETLLSKVEASLKGEEDAGLEYTALSFLAQQMEEYEIARIFEEMAADERRHKENLKKFKSRLTTVCSILRADEEMG